MVNDTADAGKNSYNWKFIDKTNKDLSACIKNRDKNAKAPSNNKMADEFYAPDAFGEVGIKARIKEMEGPYRDIYGSMREPYAASKRGIQLEKMPSEMIYHLKSIRQHK